MAKRKLISINGLGTTGSGSALSFNPPTQQVGFTVSVIQGSTKAVLRAQASIDGIRWTNLGAAATTFRSTQAGTIVSATAAYPFTQARLVCTSLTTSAGATAEKVYGVIIAK